MKGQIIAQFHVVGHLIDSGLLSEVLEAIHVTGASSEVRKLEIGKNRTDESELLLVVVARPRIRATSIARPHLNGAINGHEEVLVFEIR